MEVNYACLYHISTEYFHWRFSLRITWTFRLDWILCLEQLLQAKTHFPSLYDVALPLLTTLFYFRSLSYVWEAILTSDCNLEKPLRPSYDHLMSKSRKRWYITWLGYCHLLRLRLASMPQMSHDSETRSGLRSGLTNYGDEEFALFLRKAFIKGAGCKSVQMPPFRPSLCLTREYFFVQIQMTRWIDALLEL